MVAPTRLNHETATKQQSSSRPASRPATVHESPPFQRLSRGGSPPPKLAGSPLLAKVYDVDKTLGVGSKDSVTRAAANKMAQRLEAYERSSVSRRPAAYQGGTAFMPYSGTGVPAWQRRGLPSRHEGAAMGTATMGAELHDGSPRNLCVSPTWAGSPPQLEGAGAMATSASTSALPTRASGGLLDLSAQPGMSSRRLLPAGHPDPVVRMPHAPLMSGGQVPPSTPNALPAAFGAEQTEAGTRADAEAKEAMAQARADAGKKGASQEIRCVEDGGVYSFQSVPVPNVASSTRPGSPDKGGSVGAAVTKRSSLEAACQPAAFDGRQASMMAALPSRPSAVDAPRAESPSCGALRNAVPSSEGLMGTQPPSRAFMVATPPAANLNARIEVGRIKPPPQPVPMLSQHDVIVGAPPMAARQAMPVPAKRRAKAKSLDATTHVGTRPESPPKPPPPGPASRQPRSLKTLPPPSAASGGLALREAAASPPPIGMGGLVGFGLVPSASGLFPRTGSSAQLRMRG